MRGGTTTKLKLREFGLNQDLAILGIWCLILPSICDWLTVVV